MPAVQLARLRIQIVRLSELFQDPPAFRQGLESLLEHYGDRSYRHGEEIIESGQIPSFNVPPLVMRQLEMELNRVTGDVIQCNFELLDSIWKSEYREMRQIAIFLLGRASANEPKSYFTTLKKWCQPGEDTTLLAELLAKSGVKIRASDPAAWLAMVNNWCRHKNYRVREIGLIALDPLLSEHGLENLPEIFNILEPLLLETDLALQKRLLVTCQRLYRTSPVEALEYFKHLIQSNASGHFLRLMRRFLPSLSSDDQVKMRQILPRSTPSIKNQA